MVESIIYNILSTDKIKRKNRTKRSRLVCRIQKFRVYIRGAKGINNSVSPCGYIIYIYIFRYIKSQVMSEKSSKSPLFKGRPYFLPGSAAIQFVCKKLVES